MNKKKDREKNFIYKMKRIREMSKKNQVVHVSDMIPYIQSGQLKFSHRVKNNESILYVNLKSLAIHPAMYSISFDKKCELECISEDTGMTCLMLALELYNHPTVKKDRGYQNQVLSIVQQIFFRYEKNIEHKDKKGKNLLYYFIKNVDNSTDKNMVGFLIQHLLFEYLEKEIPIDWDIEDENGYSIRFLFLKKDWNHYVHLTPPLKESFEKMDMKKRCNFTIMDELHKNKPLLEKCIELIQDDSEIERYELTDMLGNTILQTLIMMMNEKDEDFLINLINNPKFFFFTYNYEKPKQHIMKMIITKKYYRLAIHFLEKMKETNDWNEFISILLDPEVGFYEFFSNHIEEIEIKRPEESYSILELLEWIFSHDKHKRTIDKMNSKNLISISILKHNDIYYVDFAIFQRIMNYEDAIPNKMYMFDDHMCLVIQYMKNSLKMNEYKEEDLIHAFERLLSHMEFMNFQIFFQCIQEYESLMRIVFDIPRIQRHVSSYLRQFKKEELCCTMKKEEDESCSICLESLKELYYTCKKCTKGTHINCFSLWIKENPTCVTCRTKISNDDKKRINTLDKYLFYQDLSNKYMMNDKEK